MHKSPSGQTRHSLCDVANKLLTFSLLVRLDLNDAFEERGEQSLLRGALLLLGLLLELGFLLGARASLDETNEDRD